MSSFILSKPPRFQNLMYIGLLSFATYLCAQSPRVGSELPNPYHPNRPGAQAYAQGGAFVANAGSVTSMLFNPAGIATLDGKLAFTLEAGWNSRTQYLPFFNDTFSPQTHPMQFAGLAFSPRKQWAVGAYYIRPTDYALDFGEIEVTTPENPEASGDTYAPVFERRQFGFGFNIARRLSTSWILGMGVEWRRAEVRDEISSFLAEGSADAVRFALGTVVQLRDWHLGVSLRSQYKATGDALFRNGTSDASIDLLPNDTRRYVVTAENFGFTAKEPTTVRVGFASPQLLQRLRLSGDVEFKDFSAEDPIPKWQFYGGTTLNPTSFLQLALGTFTFRKDYSSFVDGPRSEVFLTCGGKLKLAHFEINASFMEGDVLNQNFEGQRFLNLAVGYVLP